MSFPLVPRGPFSLARAAAFAEGFADAWRPYRSWIVLLLRAIAGRG